MDQLAIIHAYKLLGIKDDIISVESSLTLTSFLIEHNSCELLDINFRSHGVKIDMNFSYLLIKKKSRKA